MQPREGRRVEAGRAAEMKHQRHVQNSTEPGFTGRFGSQQEQESRETLMGLQETSRQEVEGRTIVGRSPD